MSLFDSLVAQAIENQSGFGPLQVVIEKELLHHDILREMSSAGMLKTLTFIGGSSLRACYGSQRLSEDLDFTGGKNFKRKVLADIGDILVNKLQIKYNLKVEVTHPIKETEDISTWKIKVITRPKQKNLPMQKINIDVCSIPSYDKQPMLLRNHYGVDMGTSGLIIQVQSREEILADKIIAFALRPNRIKNRDLWDIGWLNQQNIYLPLELVAKKITDHKQKAVQFIHLITKRTQILKSDPSIRKEFIHEMQRFLPSQAVNDTIKNKDFWIFLTNVIQSECSKVIHYLNN